jgi:hypothetical protein
MHLRRRREVEIALRLPAVENLFAAPELDPFAAEYERYGAKPGIETIAAELRAAKSAARVRTTLELPAGTFESSFEQRVADAVRRYCNVKLMGPRARAP